MLVLWIVLVIGCVVAVCGCTSNSDNNTTSNTSASSSPDTPKAGTQIEVNYSGSWSGSYGDTSGQQSVDGRGTKKFDIPENPWAVSACFQKKDSGKGTLTVSIIKDGKVVESKSTSTQYGVVSISK